MNTTIPKIMNVQVPLVATKDPKSRIRRKIVALMLVIFIGLLLFPIIAPLTSKLMAPQETQLLGSPLQVIFVGGIVIKTQINIDGRAYLVDGVVHLKPQALLEKRSYRFDEDRLCVHATNDCWRLL